MRLRPACFFLFAASVVFAAATLGLAALAPLRGAPAAPAAPAAACPHCAPNPPTDAAEPAPAYSRESIYQLDARFTNDSGNAFALGELRGRPVVLNMFFASCGYACPLQVTDMLALRGKLAPGVRERAVFVLVSFDVAHDTPAELARYRAQRNLDGQWILLHGDNAAVRELAALVGVKYRQDAKGTFSHSNILTILNSEGEIVHQRVGLKGGLDDDATALTATVK